MNIHIAVFAQINEDVRSTGLPAINLTPGSIEGILQLVFGIAGALTVLMVVYGGLKYVISQGDPQATAKAKDTILYALIGMVVCILSFSIVTFVASRV